MKQKINYHVPSSGKVNMIVTDYTDDEGIKELHIIEVDMYKDLVAIRLKDTMKARTSGPNYIFI